MTTCECIILGLGGFGSAAARHAARRGARVIGIEQFSPAHDRGSSHGETRIIRRAYFEHPDYVPLLRAAYPLWRELEQQTGRDLFTTCGLILCGPPDAEAIAGTRHAARVHALDLEQFTAGEAARRFPCFRFDDAHDVLSERDAGYLRVEACVEAHLAAARAAGADVRFGERCLSWSADRSSVRVVTDREVYSAAQLILAAGAWSGQQIPGLPPLEIRRKVQTWHRVRGEAISAHETSPAFLFELPRGAFYGFPCLDGATIKVAEHSRGRPVGDPGELDRDLHGSDARPLAAFLQRHLPAVDPAPLRHSVCMYTMSPDGHFIVDRLPPHQNVTVAAGFSGHGFKFTPVIGQALAELACEGRTDLPIGFLGLSRFQSAERRKPATTPGD